MKKLLILATALVVAIGINAAVVELDLSKAQAYFTAGSSTLDYNAEEGVLTVNWSVTTGWEVSGAQIALKSLQE